MQIKTKLSVGEKTDEGRGWGGGSAAAGKGLEGGWLKAPEGLAGTDRKVGMKK